MDNNYYVYTPGGKLRDNSINNLVPVIKTNIKGKKPIIIGILLFLIVILVSGGLYFAYTKQFWPFQEGESRILLAKSIENIKNIESALYSFSFALESKIKDAKDEPYKYQNTAGEASMPGFIDNYIKMAKSSSSLPANFKIAGNLSGNLQKNASQSTDMTFKIGGEGIYKDFSINLELEFLRKNKDVYAKLNAFPILFLEKLSAIKQKWIKISSQDLTNSTFSPLVNQYIDPKIIKKEQEKTVALKEQLKTFFTMAQEQQLLIMKCRPTEEKLNNVGVFHYKFALNKDTLANFYKITAQNFESNFKENAFYKFDQELFDELRSPQVKNFIDYINQYDQIDFFVNKTTSYPMRLSLTSKLIPQAEAGKLNNEGLLLTISLELTSINQSITINAPTESISLEDAYLQVMGISKEEYQFEQQAKNVNMIRNALMIFKNSTGVYPDSLEQLIGKSLGRNIPNDIFVQQAFGYIKTTDNNYKLTYQMQLPPYKSEGPLNALIYNDNTFLNKKTGKYIYSISLKYIPKLNTADKDNLSLEAKIQSKIDSDKDGLSDSFEIYIGTDPHKKDTNGDGHLDPVDIYAHIFSPLSISYPTISYPISNVGSI